MQQGGELFLELGLAIVDLGLEEMFLAGFLENADSHISFYDLFGDKIIVICSCFMEEGSFLDIFLKSLQVDEISVSGVNTVNVPSMCNSVAKVRWCFSFDYFVHLYQCVTFSAVSYF